MSAEEIDGVREDIREMKTALSRMADAMVRLAVLEERHLTVAGALERAFSAISKLEARVRELEQLQPVQKLASGWVTGAVSFGGGLLASIVLKKMGVL